jgi:hypothetical protein
MPDLIPYQKMKGWLAQLFPAEKALAVLNPSSASNEKIGKAKCPNGTVCIFLPILIPDLVLNHKESCAPTPWLRTDVFVRPNSLHMR